MIIATAGHVDHGKTLLVKTLTGVDTDRLPEEKARGLTIELGFAYHDLGDGQATGFVDVPGHERFIRTMVAGVAGIDCVLFVIAADDGPMPQTAEHLAILDLLGVTRGVVALTKVDRVDAAHAAAVGARIAQLLAPTRLAALPIVPVSAYTGTGIGALRTALLDLSSQIPLRPRGGEFRLAIDRSFLLKGAGRIVTGTIVSGEVAVGDAVWHVPGGSELRVRSLHAQNRDASTALAGQRCALNISGANLRDDAIRRGDWMVGRGAAFTTRRVDAEVRVLASEVRALSNRTPVHLHIGAADVTGRVVTLDGAAIEPGASALVHLQLEQSLHCVRGDRLVLRDQSAQRTVGGGEVIDPEAQTRGHTRDERRSITRALHAADATHALVQVAAACAGGFDLARFGRAFNLRADELAQLVAASAVKVCRTPDLTYVFTAARWQALAAAVQAALAAHHAAVPEARGIGELELTRATKQKVKRVVWSALIEELVAARTLVRDGAQLRLPDHAAQRSAADDAMWRRVEPLLAQAAAKTPVVHDLATALNITPVILDGFLARAAKRGQVVRVSAKRYFLPATVSAFEDIVHALAEASAARRFAAADFRDRAGIGRNAAIEVLEYFDRAGLTRRQGDLRTLLKPRRA